jgi:hypothetical protein
LNTDVSDQYKIATFSSYVGGRISTAFDCSYGGSCPNGIIATSGFGANYWPTADVYVNFAVPVNGLSFKILGSAGGGSGGLIDVYVNNAYFTTTNFSSGIGFPGQILPPITINLSSIQHITAIRIRQVENCGDFQFCIFHYALYYDDFTFTPEINVSLTNHRIITQNGALIVLNGTTVNALLAADVFLETNITPPDQGTGKYSWDVQGSPSISGGTNKSSIHIRWKQTGNYTVILTYTNFNATVTAGLTVKVIAPTLISFSANADPEQVGRDMKCSKGDGVSNSYAAVTVGCWKGVPNPLSGVVFTTQARIPDLTYVTEVGEAGIMIKQYIKTFRKRINDRQNNGTVECEGHRDSFGQLIPVWQVDGDQDISPFLSSPPKFFEGNTLPRTALDAPGSYLDGTAANGDVFMHDASYTEEYFETYVYYFVGDSSAPLFATPLKLENESHQFSVARWSRNLLAVFDPSVPTIKYRIVWSNSSQGNIPITGTDTEPPFQGNGSSLLNRYAPCVGEFSSTNKIDGARCYVKQQYWDFLNRAPEQVGWDFWLGVITHCGLDRTCINDERVHVAKAFFFSAEFIQQDPDMANPPGSPNFDPAIYNPAFVRHCYNNFLRRAPDAEGSKFWTDAVNNDGDYDHLIRSFIVSAEYRNRSDFHECP